MKVMLFEISRGAKARQVLAIAESAGQARAHVQSRFTGWTVSHGIEVEARPVHFVLGDLEPAG